MKKPFKKIYLGTVKEIPQSGLFRFVRRDHFGIFYHMVCDHPPAHTRHLYLHRPTSIFEQDLQYLRLNFPILSYTQLKESRTHSFKQSKPAVHLSFDDGFAGCYDVVRPLLHKYGLPATFFLPTDFIGNERMYYRNKVSLCIDQVMNSHLEEQKRIFQLLSQDQHIELSTLNDFYQWIKAVTEERVIDQVCQLIGIDINDYLKQTQPYLSWEQVREMMAEGFTIGAHSKKHYKLARLTPNEIRDEIIGSCNCVKEKTGNDEVPFSFPNSGDGIDRELLDEIHRSNPWISLFFDTKGLKKDRNYIINRIWAESPKYSPDGATPMSLIIHAAYQEFLSNR